MAHQVFSGKIGQAVEARMRTRAMQRSKCTIVLKVFATRTAWDFHNVIPTDHRSFLKCNVLLGMSIKDIVKMSMHNNNYFYKLPAQVSKSLQRVEKVFPHLSWASNHLIMQCFTSLKPPYIVGPVCFGLFGYDLRKTMLLLVILKKNRIKNLPFCASKWMVINYMGWIISNHVQINCSKSNWS